MIHVVPEARDYSQHIARASNKVFNKVSVKIFITGLSLVTKGTAPIFKSVESDNSSYSLLPAPVS